MRKIIVWVFIFISSMHAIEEYRVVKKYYTDGKTPFLLMREFKEKGQNYGLFANMQTLQTQIFSLDTLGLKPLHKNSPTLLETLLTQATSLSSKGGFSHARTTSEHAVYLTMDLCPSRQSGFESDFLNHLSTCNGKTPLAIAITSVWIDQHPEAFETLRMHPLLDITWINHSHTHFYDKTLPDKENFMLHAKTDVDTEIVELEKKLIEMGITPSLFFRFPGLMANDALIKTISQTYSLIPLGADAWIAKHEPIKGGSFILIHGNKNEPEGIRLLEQKLPWLLKKFTLTSIHKAFVP